MNGIEGNGIRNNNGRHSYKLTSNNKNSNNGINLLRKGEKEANINNKDWHDNGNDDNITARRCCTRDLIPRREA